MRRGLEPPARRSRSRGAAPARRDRRGRAAHAQRGGRMVRAGYDAAETTDENRRHWANADALSAAAAASPERRAILRRRARYEVANNSIARGIVSTLANDLVGVGPRLQLTTEDEALNRRVEIYWQQWAQASRLATKLRTMRMAKAQDGETFGLLTTNGNLASPVRLDLQLLEADRVATPQAALPDEQTAVDGIEFDEFGNPAAYHILRRHPGALWLGAADPFAYDRVPASQMVHWFTVARPGQRRGVPDLLPALPLFALLRRFVLATLTSAEIAADLSLVMKTTAPPGGEAAEVDPWTTMELERNTAMFAPEGWEPTQLRAEHPAETFTPFRRAIINEIARCLNMPYNVAAGDSSDYSYASGRLDHQMYYRSISVERSEVETTVLDLLLSAWLAEALRVPDYALFAQTERIFWPHDWLWPAQDEIDPRWLRARIDVVRAGLETEAQYHARHGEDWEEQIQQRRRETEARTRAKVPQPWETRP